MIPYLPDNRIAGSLVLMLVLVLTGCGQSVPSLGTPPAQQVTSQVPDSAVPGATPAQGASTDQVDAMSRPAPPVPAPPGADSSGPALSSMKLAPAPLKTSVPVDLRYQFDGDVDSGRWVTLHLAAVPRVSGTNLKVSIKATAGIRASAEPLSAQKATIATAYRQQLSVARLAGGPQELRVLVTMELPGGSAFGWFSVPFEKASTPSIQATQKQRSER